MHELRPGYARAAPWQYAVNRVTNKNVTHAIKTLHLYVTSFTISYTV